MFKRGRNQSPVFRHQKKQDLNEFLKKTKKGEMNQDLEFDNPAFSKFETTQKLYKRSESAGLKRR